MDKLKQLLALKKPKQKLTIQKQQLQKQKQQFIKNMQEQKKHKQQQQRKKLSQIQQFYGKPKKQLKKQQQLIPPISVEEVIQKLRKLYQPATLFGQNAYRRYERLLKAQKFHHQHPNQDMKLYDEQFIKKIKQNQQYQELDAKYRHLLIQPKILNDLQTRKKKQTMIMQQKDKSFTQMCDEIYLWIIKVIKDWGQTLYQRYHDQRNPEIQKKFQILDQTTQELSTFYQVLKHRSGDKDMIQSIYHIMNCCLIREYVQANSRYIDLSIGNAPWPMGVAMLGISVRKNAERLSYVLDNEMTRKWILGIKRLLTVSQQMYPNEQKIKMVGYTVLKMI